MSKLTFGSLFAGIGGFDLGFERAGMECKWQVEIDPYCTRVLEKHWPNVRRHDDVRTFPPDESDEWRVDVICGGFPCQDISYAGTGIGLLGAKSSLFFQLMRVVREVGPRFVVLENVAALLDRGLADVLGSLSDSGFDAEWRTYRASQFGAPHLRDRLFIFGYRRELHSAVSAIGGVLADPGSESRWIQQPQRRESASKLLANGADVPGDRPGSVYRQGEAATSIGRWSREPRVRRVGYGLSNWMDRRRCLGNSIVPDIAEHIGRRLTATASPPQAG